MLTNLPCKSVFQAAGLGAALGLAGALVYGMLFVIYGILHTSLWIIAGPANGLLPTLVTNALSVLIGAMFFAVLYGLLAALIQAGTLALVYGLARRLNPRSHPRAGAWIGFLTAAGLYLALLLLLRAGPPMMTQVFWQQSFLFWFGLPGALYLALNAWLGSRLRFGAARAALASARAEPGMAVTR